MEEEDTEENIDLNKVSNGKDSSYKPREKRVKERKISYVREKV